MSPGLHELRLAGNINGPLVALGNQEINQATTYFI